MSQAAEFHKAFYRYLILYFGLVLTGVAALLMDNSLQLSFAEALFTAVSLSTLTGFDIAGLSGFSLGGQLVALGVLQLGAILQAGFFIFIYSHISHDITLLKKSSFNRSLLTAAVFILGMEAAGFLALYAFAGADNWANLSERAYFALFHAVSIFNLAGVSYLENGFANYIITDAYILQLVMVGIIGAGYAGFIVFLDLTSIARLRYRLANPSVGWAWHTRFILYGSAAAISVSAITFFLLEANNSLRGSKPVETAISTMLNAVSITGAGYFTALPQQFEKSMLLLISFLMLVVRSTLYPYSPGCMAFSAESTGKWKRSLIPAAVLAIYSSISFTALSLLEPDKESFYLTAASLSNAGNNNLTLDLSAPGNVILMVNMLAGYVGMPWLALRLLQNYH